MGIDAVRIVIWIRCLNAGSGGLRTRDREEGMREEGRNERKGGKEEDGSEKDGISFLGKNAKRLGQEKLAYSHISANERRGLI